MEFFRHGYWADAQILHEWSYYSALCMTRNMGRHDGQHGVFYSEILEPAKDIIV